MPRTVHLIFLFMSKEDVIFHNCPKPALIERFNIARRLHDFNNSFMQVIRIHRAVFFLNCSKGKVSFAQEFYRYSKSRSSKCSVHKSRG